MEQPPPPPVPGRLTLKTTSSALGPTSPPPGISGSSAMSPGAQTPSAGPGKIKLVRKSLPPTPAEPNPPSSYFPPVNATADAVAVAPPTLPKITTTKAGRRPKPTLKKRAHQSDDDEDVPLANGSGPFAKKTKITLKPTTPGGSITTAPKLKLKPVGKIPHRPLGEGYDSEAEDREIDPVIEEQFVLRMPDNEDCDYIRQCIHEKKIGNGAEVNFKFLDDEGRRAVWIVRGKYYAAILLDLPTITEGMKTWDKKAMVKSADICQMMLVFAEVKNEEEARTAPLPKAVEHGHRWPHGITPPMHDARNRRFRKRLSKLEIQNKEAEVERLLAADKEALSTRTEVIDSRIVEESESEDYDEDAEGEEDDEQLDKVEEELDEEALMDAFMNAPETPMDGIDQPTPAVAPDAVTPLTANTGTPVAQTEEEEVVEEEESDEDEEESEEDGDDDDDDDGDEDDHDDKASVRAEIANLKKQLKTYEEQLAKSVGAIIRKRIEASIRSVKSEIDLKMSSIGEVEDY
ncbi:putative transcription initiation factor TFIID subunit 7 [Triangularia verruculosa]|uniref:Transcription initiation factor TFIID subunit 7 n=1 Tax=Triangularia verruculosa TaxID=2587418 RepID=A0AAN6XK59_9PEZI|nr:putative transcription initiation factor TFIID subunit 7 [Triangularia verruculosa]